MSDKTGLGDRMKRYERVTDHALPIKTPVIIRVDGKAFHTFTRGCEKPWDARLVNAMCAAASALCEGIDGARFAYLQSDEISVLVADWSSLQSQPWLGYRLQKLCSVASSIATAEFNASMPMVKLALFDARAFSVPHHEVVNYFIWRQQDATRNSISGLAQSHFSHRQLHGKNTKAMQEMLHAERGINWNDLPAWQKRGYTVIKRPCGDDRTAWALEEPPIFSQERGYIHDIADEGEL